MLISFLKHIYIRVVLPPMPLALATLQSLLVYHVHLVLIVLLLGSQRAMLVLQARIVQPQHPPLRARHAVWGRFLPVA